MRDLLLDSLRDALGIMRHVDHIARTFSPPLARADVHHRHPEVRRFPDAGTAVAHQYARLRQELQKAIGRQVADRVNIQPLFGRSESDCFTDACRARILTRPHHKRVGHRRPQRLRGLQHLRKRKIGFIRDRMLQDQHKRFRWIKIPIPSPA